MKVINSKSCNLKNKDLTFVVISYEVYETGLWRVSLISYEMTTNVRLCLSYDYMTFKLQFMAVEAKTFFSRKHNAVTDDVMTLCASNQVLCNVWLFLFMT